MGDHAVWPAAWAGLRYIHAGDEAVAKLVRMVDGGVEEEVAFQIVDDLVHGDHPVALSSGSMDTGST